MKKTLALVLCGTVLGSTVSFAATKYFYDVQEDAWYSDSVMSLSEKGIIQGYPDGSFKPNSNVNRAELAVMMDRMIDYMEGNEITQVVTSNLCTDAPENSDIGRMIYPIDKKYENLDFLGQFFTAYNCGDDRLNSLFGVENNEYTLGSTIWLNEGPDQSLLNELEDLGFLCLEESTNSECQSWQMSGSVPVQDLIRLEPFYSEFQSDDCVNCG